VHCHGGASRTGLVLRAWLMRQGSSADEATALMRERWPAFGEWNESFTSFLRQGR
jgi:ADP-ribosyl-[dinitrogen reductase] hydrolase